MIRFALRHMATRKLRIALTALSIVVSAGVALLAYNISTQVSEGIIGGASRYDLIIGPAGSSTQLAMNTLFFTDQPLGTIPYDLVDELMDTGMVNEAVPFSMGDRYNDSPVVGTTPALLTDKPLKEGEMFAESLQAVIGCEVAENYGLKVGDSLITSHGLSGSGAEHAASPLTVTGILARTNSAFDRAVFTPCATIWALHSHEEEESEEAELSHEDEAAGEGEASHDAETHDSHGRAEEEEGSTHAHEQGEICAVLVRCKSVGDYTALSNHYKSDANLLAINPNNVLREVLENVDLSRTIVYALCAIVLVMNLLVISVIAALNLYDQRREIALMRLIGVSMGRINQLYLLQNALIGLVSVILSLAAAHAILWVVRGFVAGMGITLNALHVYAPEWAILAVVFAVSTLPTVLMTMNMSRHDPVEGGK